MSYTNIIDRYHRRLESYYAALEKHYESENSLAFLLHQRVVQMEFGLAGWHFRAGSQVDCERHLIACLEVAGSNAEIATHWDPDNYDVAECAGFLSVCLPTLQVCAFLLDQKFESCEKLEPYVVFLDGLYHAHLLSNFLVNDVAISFVDARKQLVLDQQEGLPEHVCQTLANYYDLVEFSSEKPIFSNALRAHGRLFDARKTDDVYSESPLLGGGQYNSQIGDLWCAAILRKLGLGRDYLHAWWSC